MKVTNQQYAEGLVDFTPVYLFQSVLASQQDQLAATRGEIALSLVQVYRSLGGGWQIRLGNQPLGKHGGTMNANHFHDEQILRPVVRPEVPGEHEGE